MKRNSPLVSVLMPVYNAEAYLDAAVNSILTQSFTDYELIAIDDGSTDRSPAILQRYAKHDRRVRIRSRPNTGYVRALNEGLTLARAQLIGRMDADDISMPGRFEHQVAFLENHPDVVAVSGHYEYMDKKGRHLTTMFLPEDDESIQKVSLEGSPGLCHGCVLMRRSALERLGGYREEMEPAEDLDLWLRLGEVGRLANVPRVLLKVRLHSESQCELRRMEDMDRLRQACEQAYTRRGIAGHCVTPEPWRPGRDRNSRHRYWLRCGWWAFNSGERRTAILYGAKAIALQALNIESWRLFACAILKHMPSTSS